MSDGHPPWDRTGENHNGSKLTNAQADEIRARYAAARTSQREIGQEYGLSGSSVGRILRGQSYQEKSQ